jgi:iron complex transport system permease protein
MRWKLNVLALGDEESRASGLNTELLKAVLLICACVLSTSVVAVAGMIPMIGLTFPHIVRLIVGADNRRTVPFSFLLGGMLLLAIDDCSRAASSIEIPIGVFTTIISGPIFICLLRTRRLGRYGEFEHGSMR